MRCPSCHADPCDCFDDLDTSRPWTEEERRPLPTFGCACENALIVDTTCHCCIEWLRRRDAESQPGAQPTTEMDDVETEPQCRACLRAWADCNCPAKGNA